MKTNLSLTIHSPETKALALKFFPGCKPSPLKLKGTLLTWRLFNEMRGREHLLFTKWDFVALYEGSAFTEASPRVQRAFIEDFDSRILELRNMSAEICRVDSPYGFCLIPAPQEAFDAEWDKVPPTEEEAAGAYRQFQKRPGILISKSSNGAAAVAYANLNCRNGQGKVRVQRQNIGGWNNGKLLAASAVKQLAPVIRPRTGNALPFRGLEE